MIPLYLCAMANDTPWGTRATVIVIRPIGSLVNEMKRSTDLKGNGENYAFRQKGESQGRLKKNDKKKK